MRSIDNLINGTKRVLAGLAFGVYMLSPPVVGCDDEITNNYYNGEDVESNGNNYLSNFCQELCSDYECAADFDLPENQQNCKNECELLLVSCSKDTLNQMEYCFNNFPCDGQTSWLDCLDEIDHSSCLK